MFIDYFAKIVKIMIYHYYFVQILHNIHNY